MDIFTTKPGTTEVGYVGFFICIAVGCFIGIWAAIHDKITLETGALVTGYLTAAFGGRGYLAKQEYRNGGIYGNGQDGDNMGGTGNTRVGVGNRPSNMSTMSGGGDA